MKVIVAGSRDLNDYAVVDKIISDAVNKYPIKITELIHGGAKGVDSIAGVWARNHSFIPKVFKAKWDDLTAPGAVIRLSPWGRKYNSKAGHDRNRAMAEYGEVLIAVWDGKSPGTKDMISIAKEKGLKVYVYIVDKNGNLKEE